MNVDAIIIGGGHAGAEAALALVRLGFETILVTANPARIGEMSCNPAIGGQAKGHLVREIDALGGEMGHAADDTAIQFRRLNTRKGPAVRASRVQSDMDLYARRIQDALSRQPGLTVRSGMVERLRIESGRVSGVRLEEGEEIRARGVILATGTFLNAVLHTGFDRTPGGRVDDPPSTALAAHLAALGIALGRLKTGTTPRLDAATIDFSLAEAQPPDPHPIPFSRRSVPNGLPQVNCHIVHTNAQTHAIIRGGLSRSPLYSGRITGRGPRYCPSIEDKVVRFADKERHQIFLEPEGLSRGRIYPNGLSTSLPLDIQEAYIRSIPAMREAVILQPGYAVEYDFIPPTQLTTALESKAIPGLYFAGQVNGTSGYEEAAAQGLMAGINLARALKGRPPVVLRRDQAYIGVLIDDLTTLGTEEPYRMFTSRAEHRLMLREDNAHFRLARVGHEVGLVPDERFEEIEREWARIESEVARARRLFIPPTPGINDLLTKKGSAPLTEPAPLGRLLKRPELDATDLPLLHATLADLPVSCLEAVEVALKYEGYIERQEALAARQSQAESTRIPESFDYRQVGGLSREVLEKLERVRPRTLGQAQRISGVTPAAVSLLLLALARRRGRAGSEEGVDEGGRHLGADDDQPQDEQKQDDEAHRVGAIDPRLKQDVPDQTQ